MRIVLDAYYIYIAFLKISIAALFALGCVTLTRKPSRLQISNLLIILFAIFYTVAYYQEIHAENLLVVRATLKVEYVGVSGMLIAYTWFMKEYNGEKRRNWIFVIEGIFTLVSLLCIFGLEQNTLFFKILRVVRYEHHFSVVKEPGILYYCYYIYYLSIFLVSVYICIGKIKESRGLEKRRCILFLCGVVSPFLSVIIESFNPNQEFDLYKIGILGFVVFFTIAVNQADFLNSVQTEQELDFLTGLNKRGYFIEKVQQNLNNQNKGSIIMVDMDDFKFINDHYGHQTGDKVLETLGKVIKCAAKPEDCACRIGGDEFCLYLHNVTKRREILAILNGIKTSFQVELKVQGIEFRASVSMGIAVYSGKQKESFEKFYEQADKALYLVKNSGKGKYKFYE